MVNIKPGVIFRKLTPEMLRAIQTAEIVYRAKGYKNITITSAIDGDHSDDSLHYEDQALDFRINDVNAVDRKPLQHMLQLALGQDYDVLLESVGTPNEHIHIEYDP